ncbi:MAG: hypothetical protein HDR24_12885 [Lachnospiraceae bacterium]|nr:hypothetical protein [Lachnospiraceae bacterium]
MNILVIGNGFDLAHGLPTKYGDFLEFCERARRIYTYREDAPLSDYKFKNIDNWQINDYIKTILSEAFDKRNCKIIPTGGTTYRVDVTTLNKLLDELYEHIKQNTWLEYFLKCHSFVGENWIDFESEISRVIQSLDTWRNILENGGSKEELSKEKQEVLMSICKVAKGSMRESNESVQAIDKFTKFLNVELEKLIRALEIYIAEFVAKIKISQRNSNIDKLNIGHVLSFNYSDTYKNLYGVNKKIRYDYIHGRADINNTLESNNMVLGIDEYLTKKKRNKETKFIAFKKYYQRIYKGTGCEYKNWIYKIKKSNKSIEKKLSSYIKFTNNMRHNLYIFGHSLDVTDKDILRDLILNDNVYTTIYYHKTYDDSGKDDNGRTDLGSKIANLVKVIGQDELIRRTGGSTKTIEFELQ